MSAMCYAASTDGWPGYICIVDDEASDGQSQERLATFFHRAAKCGYTVDRVTRERAADGMMESEKEYRRRALVSLGIDHGVDLSGFA
jgi:hypothetical protein